MTVRLELSNTSGIAHTGPTSYEFADGPVKLGRASKSDVVLDGQVISRVHVLLDVVHGAWHATHEGRMTPSVLNGVPLEPGRPTRLTDGDQLVVGDYELQVNIPDDSFVPELDPLSSVATFAGSSETRTTAQGMPAPDAAPEWETSTPGLPSFDDPGRAAPPGPSGRATPTLMVVKGGEPLQLELSEVGRPYVIGRANTCDLTLAYNAISRQHAQVRFDGTTVYVRDMGSRNPLRVNGRPLVGETPIEHGATIGMGPIELRLSLESGIAGRVAAEPMMGGDQTVYEAPPMQPPQPAAPPPQPRYTPPPPAPPPPAAAPAPDWDASPPFQPRGGAAWENESGGFGGPPPLPVGFDDAPAPKDPPPPPAWGGAAPAAPAAPSGPSAGPDFAGAGGEWGGPPPVVPLGGPPAAPPPPAWGGPPAGMPPPPAAPGGFPGATVPAMPPPVPPGGLPPPAPPGGLAPPGAPGGMPPPAVPGMPPVAPTGAAEPKVVARQSPSGKGWLLAGSLSMVAAVVLGVIFILVYI